MSRPGMGVMLRMLSGGDRGGEHFAAAIGKEIVAAELVSGENEWGRGKDQLVLRFTDGTGIAFSDDGQSCCESRYMRTDDDLSHHVGAKLVDAEIRDAEETTGEYGDVHEIQFLVVTTDRGSFTMASHNKHNGYYGGFWLRVDALPAPPESTHLETNE